MTEPRTPKRPQATGAPRRITKRGLKAKGDKFERELATYIAKETGLHVERAPLSGGGVIGQLSGGADLIGTPGFHVEAKRVERLSFPEAMRQAEGSLLKRRCPDAALIVNRRNRMATKDSFTVLRLDTFLTLYRAWLLQEGHIKPETTDD